MDPSTDPILIAARGVGDWGVRLVVWGVAGEVIFAAIDFVSEKRCRAWHKKWKGTLGFLEIVSGAIVVLGLAFEWRGHNDETQFLDAQNTALYQQAQATESHNLELQTNVASMNVALLKLAKQYDMSTNALAEAEARLSLIKPIKERLVDCLNAITPQILDALKKQPSGFWLPVRCGADSTELSELELLCREKSSEKFIRDFKQESGITMKSNGKLSWNIDFMLNPELLQ